MALHYAIRNKLLSDVRSLVEGGADVNARDRFRRTPLLLCCLDEDEAWAAGVARMLLQAGAKVGAQDKDGRNALMFTSIFGRRYLNDLFLKAVDFDLNQKDYLGNTALHFSAIQGNQKITKKLLSAAMRARADINVRNKMGQTAAAMALHLGRIQCVEVFRENKVKANFSIKVPNTLSMRPWSNETQYLHNPNSILLDAVKEISAGAKLHQSRSDLNVHQFRRGLRVPEEVLLKIKKTRAKSRCSSANARLIGKRTGAIQNRIAIVSPPWSLSNVDTQRNSRSRQNNGKNLQRLGSWREDMFKLTKILNVQVSPSYRTSAIAVPQAFEDIFIPPEAQSQTEEETVVDKQQTSVAQPGRKKSVIGLGALQRSKTKSDLYDSFANQSPSEGKRRNRRSSQLSSDAQAPQKRKTSLLVTEAQRSSSSTGGAVHPDMAEQSHQDTSALSSENQVSARPGVTNPNIKTPLVANVKNFSTGVFTTKATNNSNEETNKIATKSNLQSSSEISNALSDIAEERLST